MSPDRPCALMTNTGTKQLASDPLQISEPAAWLALMATIATLLILGALHILSPEFSPSWRVISEYALGHYGWLLSLMFLSWGVSSWALVIAIRLQFCTTAGRLGLAFLVVAGVGESLAAFFDVTHPVGHGIAGLLGVIGFPIAALLLTTALRHNETWRTKRKGLLGLSNLSWVSVVLLVTTLAIMTLQLRAANRGHLPQHAPKVLPPGVLALDGWADRMIVLSNCGWVLLTAYYAIQVRRSRS